MDDDLRQTLDWFYDQRHPERIEAIREWRARNPR